ncbi:DUF6299 family protein [Streptomyces sp. NPDC006512]|uniref:DUF6299 family protein n=1 Tax=Streptomyces sp. NPDC006512 TaxID=3154307 RepID=UPI0033A0134B
MRTIGSRLALTAFSALAVTAVMAVPAEATVFHQEISVRSDAHIAEDGRVILSGSYRCEAASPVGAVQIKATVIQEGVRLTMGGGEALCDGHEHPWRAESKPGRTWGVHGGGARAEGRLEEIHFGGGMLPRAVDTVAEDARDVTVYDHRR